jgi:hypothetical protein
MLSFIDAHLQTASPWRDFQGIQTYGFSSRQGKAEGENGEIASQCYVVHLGRRLGGYGPSRIMYGQRCIRSTKDDGFMWTPARRFGIIRAYILKVSVTFNPGPHYLYV